MDEKCQNSIVCIQVHRRNDPTKISIQTGIVIASGNKSCLILTKSEKINTNVVDWVQFHDGTRKVINLKDTHKSKDNDLNIMLISIKNPVIHWEAANISKREVTGGQRVFSCGFNSDALTQHYISGSIVW